MNKRCAILILLLVLFSSACQNKHIPVCELSITPADGTLHTYFVFSSVSCSDRGNPVYALKFRWDVDGDGIWDTDFSTDREMMHQYTTPGTYTVKMEVVDPDGESLVLDNTVTVIDKNQAPIPYLKISMAKAGITTPIQLDASLSFDYEEYADLLQYRWDYNSDGVWDTPFSSVSMCTHTFNLPGSYTITLQVMDRDSATAQTTKSVTILNTTNLFSSLLDVRDSKQYPIVHICDRWWMAENLDYGEIQASATGCFDNGVYEMFTYGDVVANHRLYGGLYTWDEAVAYDPTGLPQGACPAGWHIPSDSEWIQLELALGMAADQTESGSIDRGAPIGTYLKVNGTTGFEAGLFGFWSPSVNFFGLTSEADFWSSTANNSYAWCRTLKSGSGGIQRVLRQKTHALSIRCIKDE